MKRIFVTGIPGSKWSGVAQTLEQLPQFNLTDRNSHRQYLHSEYSGHIGAYFGRGMEFECNLNEDHLNAPYTDPDAGIMLAKSHDWAYKLEKVEFYAKHHNSKVLIVWRDVEQSIDWWYKAGGFNITYPNYSDYKDHDTFVKECIDQNEAIVRYLTMYHRVLEPFDPAFIKKHFNEDLDFKFDESVKVCLI